MVWSLLTVVLGAVRAGEPVIVELAREGQPAATIVVAEKPTRAAQLAAAELQEHVRLISGATLPVVNDAAEVKGLRILVGESKGTQVLGLKKADLKPQEYLIRFLPDTLVLMGRDKDDYAKLDYTTPDGKTIPTTPPVTPCMTCSNGIAACAGTCRRSWARCTTPLRRSR
jgi:antitoxin (DNA-binding transcriptional repressor) of toxin-antitoxin stability system